MQTITRTGLVLGVFLMGCATGGAASQFAVPDAEAGDYGSVPSQQGRVSGRGFAYHVERSSPELPGRLNQLGADGWELVTVAGNAGGAVWVFKRPL